MKISIITACFNSAATMADTLKSVSGQDYGDIEHIIVDGGSTDNSLALVREHGKRVSRVISESDTGIYDALNKGIKAAGGDIVGILHSDDLYANDSVLQKVAEFMSAKSVESCYGDLVYVERGNTAKIARRWQAGEYDRENFKRGWMPPHPAFFLKRAIYEKYGLYNLAFPLASDYELMLRILYRHGISTAYLPEVLVKMRRGGTSRAGPINTGRMLLENYRAWKCNNLPVNPLTFIMKPLSKLSQFR
ncbi:MAG TPA: glycosyl transferase [Elusimicrobia bacterium]|nr:MAG: glycosyl transferase [Elusimicrobia bacterium GWA2_51_34]HAF96474.1 glycosyl transferase [Elusimicrobiota bacterium]HCE97554.1 glycosyl transferase [Elusimicrobiota bacterium]